MVADGVVSTGRFERLWLILGGLLLAAVVFAPVLIEFVRAVLPS